MSLTFTVLCLLVTLILTNFSLTVSQITYSNPHDYDAYGTVIASSDHFVVLAQNDGPRYQVSVAPFGTFYACNYDYITASNFVINVAVGRRQNSSQLSFVYLQTNSTDGRYQKLGFFTFSLGANGGSVNNTCNQRLGPNEGEHEVKVWNNTPSSLSTLQVDPYGQYAYGFLSNSIFIYDIEKSSVQDLLWSDVFPSIILGPHALDVGVTDDGVSMAIVAGYVQFDIEKTLPAVYLIRLDPPFNMTLVDNYTFVSGKQKFVQGRYAYGYQFDYVMSVSIHDSTQQVLVGVPQLRQAFLLSFNSTSLTFITTLGYSARSTSWLDEAGEQVGLLLTDTSTLPWAQSRIQVVNVSSDTTLYSYPNNQQTLVQWSSTPPTFIRLTKAYDYSLVILATDGTVVLVPTTEAGYYQITDDIHSDRTPPITCPSGTYKSTRGSTPCTICPTNTRSNSMSASSNPSNGMNITLPLTNCTACSSSSFCPLASISDVDLSKFQSISQAFAYPSSPSSTSFDDILMQNTFIFRMESIRCLVISPFFWSIILLLLVCVILFILVILHTSPTGKKRFHRIKSVFRHSDLIGNGELWVGGVVSLSIIVLIIYSFWFGTAFAVKYPIETSSDSNFFCDTSLRNAQFSSSLQLLATIKSDDQIPMFTMLNMQNFTMTVSFLQTGYTCDDVAAQENIGTYAADFVSDSCTEKSNDSTLIVVYHIPYHQIILQINLTGLYYVGGVLICLTGPSFASNDSSYVVQNLNYCELFYTSDQTLGRTTNIAFALTKVINRTESLGYSSSINYSGIWIPTTTYGSLNDRLAYADAGVFLRYLYTQHILIVDFTETQFYVDNYQQPIVRMGEIVFHNVLFTTTVIGIFALVFLLLKLTIVRTLKWMVTHKICLFLFYKLRKGK